jgi:hypothetical protein
MLWALTDDQAEAEKHGRRHDRSGEDHLPRFLKDLQVLSDRRRAPRYPIASVISVEDARAVTVNVSSIGVYFVTDQPLTAGQEVLLVLAFDHTAPAETRVTCHGRIVRVERLPEGVGAAATYEAIGFEIGTSA